MGIGYPWDNYYLEPQQKEQYSVMFINKSPKIYQQISSD